MDKPNQGMKISDPDVRSPRDSTSQRAEGLFTSELGIQGDDPDRHYDVVPTRTINLSDFQRRVIAVGSSPTRRPIPRSTAGIYLLPRVPQASVASALSDVVADGGSVVSAVTSLIGSVADTVVSDTAIATVTIVIGSQPSDSPTLITTTSASSTSSDSSSPGGGSASSASYSSASTWLSSYISTSSLSSVTSGTSNTTSALSTWSSTSSISLTSSLSTTSTASTTGTSTSEFTDANGTVQFTADSYSYPATTTLISSTRSGHQSAYGSPSSSDHSASTSAGFSDTSSSSTSSTAVVQNPPGAGYTGSTPTATSSTATTSSASSSSDGGGPGLSPQQQQVVGGVVGGVAGLAVLLLVLLVILRWYRRRLKARGELPEQIAAPGLTAGPGQPVSQRSSVVPLTSQLASSLRRLKHTSGHTQSTSISSVTVPESERGFQRIAGRKIAPVLTAGGDGFGGNYGAFRQDTDPASPPNRNEDGLAGSSSHQDGGGLDAGRGAAAAEVKSGHAHGPSLSRDFATPAGNGPNRSQASLHSGRAEGVLSLRPSPARTPVTVSPAASSVRLSIQHSPSVGDDAPPVPQIVVPFGQDDVGRTMYSQDGSRISTRSRSTGHGSRFAENI